MLPSEETMFHIMLKKSDIEGARLAIMPGDPGRVPVIAGLLDAPRALKFNREFNSYTGGLAGERIVVMSHGIGGPSTAIAVEELHMLGVDTFIRIGTCGGMQMNVLPGDSVIVTGSVRAEGTSREYLPIEFPAVADLDAAVALRDAARELGYPYHTGVVQCKDSFYGQHDPKRMPVASMLEANWTAWIRGGALASEMESATLFTVCAALGARAGAVMHCIWNQERVNAGIDDVSDHDTETAIRIAILGAEKLIKARKAE